MAKYIAIIDNRAGIMPPFTEIELTSKNLLDAMDEAEKLMDKNVYLVDIAERTGCTTDNDGSKAKRTHYKSIARNRGNGWHHCNESHGDSPMMCDMVKIGNIKFFEIQ